MTMNGSSFLLLANTGTPAAPAYEVVGSQRDGTVDENDAGIDFSSKDSRGTRMAPGRYSSTISLDGLYVPDNDAYLALRDALRDGALILVAREEEGIVIETCQAKVDSLSGSFPDQGEATVSIGMSVYDFWSEVAS